jgi:hypothetical protein
VPGLVSQAIIVKENLLIGINECLEECNLSTRVMVFSLKMTFLFHEYVDVGDFIFVRNEMVFVSINAVGRQNWIFHENDIIENYSIDD